MNIPFKKLLNILLFVPFCYLFSLIPVPLLDPVDKPDVFHSHSEATRGGYMSQISSHIGRRIQQKLKSAHTKQSFSVISIQRYFCFSSVFEPWKFTSQTIIGRPHYFTEHKFYNLEYEMDDGSVYEYS